MTTTLSTRALAERLLGRIGAGDPERIAELYAENVDWQVNWPEAEHDRSETPWIRPRSTRADIADLNRQLGEYHVPGDARVETILVDGNDAVVMGEFRQTAKPTGRAYSSRFVLHLSFENGQVVRNHVYEDSLAIAQAFAA
ncbi:MAG: nuclear transport factor 2 family protein [Actinomycetia bacterium]|nr:nuclear transport factor 2 family protein [Actinomycetes bacterium]